MENDTRNDIDINNDHEPLLPRTEESAPKRSVGTIFKKTFWGLGCFLFVPFRAVWETLTLPIKLVVDWFYRMCKILNAVFGDLRCKSYASAATVSKVGLFDLIVSKPIRACLYSSFSPIAYFISGIKNAFDIGKKIGTGKPITVCNKYACTDIDEYLDFARSNLGKEAEIRKIKPCKVEEKEISASLFFMFLFGIITTNVKTANSFEEACGLASLSKVAFLKNRDEEVPILSWKDNDCFIL